MFGNAEPDLLEYLKEISERVTLCLDNRFKMLPNQGVLWELNKIKFCHVEELGGILMDWDIITIRQINSQLVDCMLEVEGIYRVLDVKKKTRLTAKVIKNCGSHILAIVFNFFAVQLELHDSNGPGTRFQVDDMVEFEYRSIKQDNGLYYMCGGHPRLVNRVCDEPMDQNTNFSSVKEEVRNFELDDDSVAIDALDDADDADHDVAAGHLAASVQPEAGTEANDQGVVCQQEMMDKSCPLTALNMDEPVKSSFPQKKTFVLLRDCLGAGKLHSKSLGRRDLHRKATDLLLADENCNPLEEEGSGRSEQRLDLQSNLQPGSRIQAKRSKAGKSKKMLKDLTDVSELKKKGQTCGSCDGCQAPDCELCIYCKDKVKFGGKGKLKKRCKKRVCLQKNK